MAKLNANEAAFKLLTGQALSSAESAELRDKIFPAASAFAVNDIRSIIRADGGLRIQFGNGVTAGDIKPETAGVLKVVQLNGSLGGLRAASVAVSSPDQTLWSLSVDNSGTLTPTAI